MDAAIVHGRREGERHPVGPASEVVIKAAGANTRGSLFLCETVVEPGFGGPPLHRH